MKYYACVNALTGCYLISTMTIVWRIGKESFIVSMPSRAVTSFLPVLTSSKVTKLSIGVNALTGCYLIST